MDPEEIAAAEAEARRLAELAAAAEATEEQKVAAQEAQAQLEKAKEEVRKAEEAAKSRPDDESAKLLKEVMKWKDKAREYEARAKLFDGINPEKARAALAAQEEAERRAMEARGEYDRILAQVTSQAEERVAAAEARVAELQAHVDAMAAAGKEKDAANLFANSPFVRENLTISGAKVRTLFGDHFEWVEDEYVGYDKPKGAKDRTPLVDAQGRHLSFEEALAKIVKADPDFDNIAKSNLRRGPGSLPSNLQRPSDIPLTPQDKIKVGLAGLKRTSLNLRGAG